MSILDAVVSWRGTLGVVLMFGFAPRAVLRVIVCAYRKDDPRRSELLSEINAVPVHRRPIWVAEQLELALFEGVRYRIEWALSGRLIHRWRLGDGVQSNRRWPNTFEIPSDEEKDGVRPGDLVKATFRIRSGQWGERMWVEVARVHRGRVTGQLINAPVGIPRLEVGRKVRLKHKHIIEIADGTVVHFAADDEDEGVSQMLVHSTCCACCEGHH